MYSWIWRKLPFGLPGKMIGSALLIGGATALLWFVAFPAVHQWMPFNQSTIEDDTEDGGGGGGNEEPDSDSDRVDDDPEDYELEESPTPDEEDGESGDGG